MVSALIVQETITKTKIFLFELCKSDLDVPIKSNSKDTLCRFHELPAHLKAKTRCMDSMAILRRAQTHGACAYTAAIIHLVKSMIRVTCQANMCMHLQNQAATCF